MKNQGRPDVIRPLQWQNRWGGAPLPPPDRRLCSLEYRLDKITVSPFCNQCHVEQHAENLIKLTWLEQGRI